MTKHITVVGAGVMGRDIAYLAATSQFRVTLYDISQEALLKTKDYIYRKLEQSATRGFLSMEAAEQAKSEIYFEHDLSKAMLTADLAIEAVVENLDVKIELFKQMDRLTPNHCILATNTSTMSPTEIGAQTSRPERCIAMHFFNPAYKMKLIEAIRGLDTSDETFEVVREVGIAMGKEVVEVNEFPGFVTTRINCLIGNEAMNMLMEGVSTAEGIDKAIKLGLNHPMGPLELADLVGLDSRLRNMEYLYKTLGEKFRPSPILVKYVKAGRLGRKSGKGFFDYTEQA